MDFSLMETEDIELLKITEINIKLAELEESEPEEEEKDEGPMDQGLDYDENFIWSV